ncbi:V-type ATP synthase subunit F [Anaerotalea alkaliphila]|uniref:ATP synthase subunit F n=1 Tax=Anaerotalea alkaliphila TaxID=2662126 RepID=A0A7X5HTS8_9FIRM|nr:V-type ATP synthase subunit F [Anaerotalea alkaliphila]NDL66537.1 ATP synthase subunit F [Anaerotalea alkaliphila]
MRMFLISDNIDTLTGMRLAGVEGVVVHEKEEVQRAIDQVVLDRSVGILLVTEKLGKLVPEKITQIKLEYHLPLVVEIPDRHGTVRTADSITKYVREAIGLKL